MMWPAFSHNLLLISFATLTWAGAVLAQVGVLETLEEMANIHKIEIEEHLLQVQNDYKALTISSEASIKLSDISLKSIFFESPRPYLALARQSSCHFYLLLKLNLLHMKGGGDNLFVDIGEYQNVTMDQKEYFNKISSGPCFEAFKREGDFKREKIKATLKKTSFKIPKTSPQCQEIYQSWRQSTDLPYLCSYWETIKTGERARDALAQPERIKNAQRESFNLMVLKAKEHRDELNSFQYNYIDNLCSSLIDSKNFCSHYLDPNHWKRILNGEYPLEQLKYRCEDLLQTRSPTESQLNQCARQLGARPSLCQDLTIQRFPALFPKPDCEMVAQGLHGARFTSNYQDCPGHVQSEGLINLKRITRYFSPETKTDNPQFCQADPAAQFAKFNLEADNEKAWNLKACYFNPVLKARECQPLIFGSFPASPLSEEVVMAKILRRIRGTPPNLKCQITPKEEYNPNLLKYKSSCFLLYDSGTCSALDCPKTIIFRGQEIKDIQYEGEVFYDYFGTDRETEVYSIERTLARSLKLKIKSLPNLTMIQQFYQDHPQGLIHGQACLEDLFPGRFSKQGLYHCTPHLFILDRIIYRRTKPFAVIRSSLDDINSPRIIDWNYFFSMIKSYHEIHPLSTWTLHGLYPNQ